MFQAVKRSVEKILRYQPLTKTAAVRKAIAAAAVNGLPHCPAEEGDLIFSLIQTNGYNRCLETGFHTGSTALYMAAGVEDGKGSVASICIDDDESTERGLELLRNSGQDGRHKLIRENSNKTLSEMFLAGDRYDFIFMDGWKTFDHLAFEMYLFNQLLETGGSIVFDDAYMPSVRKAILLLKTYYGYQEVDYAMHNQSRRLRAGQLLTRWSSHRPYRAVTKTIDTAKQSPFLDWHFYRKI